MVCGGSFAIIRDRWVSQERNHSLRVKDSKNGDERFDCHGYVSSMFWENSSSLFKSCYWDSKSPCCVYCKDKN